MRLESFEMGFLRLYLALCVVHSHTGTFFPWTAVPGRYAVQLFFAISGFYMAMVLSERYASIGDFYRSRWQRIATPYYLHLTAILLVSVVSGVLFARWLALAAYAENPLAQNGMGGIAFAVFANLTIFGQDAVLFLKDNVGSGFQFTSNFMAWPDPLYRFLLIPQCWSVSLELMFYALVPFLNRLKTWHLGLVVAVALLVRILGYQLAGLDHDPWFYRFFPFELALFVAGMLTWRLLRALAPRFPSAGKCGGIWYGGSCLVIVVLGAWFPWVCWRLGWHLGESYSSLLLIFMAIPFIALIFHLTRKLKFDRVIGELSYPIYLNHLMIIVTLHAIPQLKPFNYAFGWITGLLSVVFAAAFWHFCLRKLEAQRHQKFGIAALPT